MRVLLLGGTKFIGPYVVQSLHRFGAEIAVFHRGQSQPERHQELLSAVRHITGDRNELEKYVSDFAAFAPDVVLDMRPLGDSDSQRVIQLFRGIAQRAVMISSIDVYRNYDVLRGKEPGLPDPIPLLENAPLRPKLYPYLEPDTPADNFGRIYDKILAERNYLSSPDLPGTVLRLPFVYGPGDYQHRLHGYLKRMDDKRPAILLSESMAAWRSSRCYVENVGHAVALAVLDKTKRASGQIYNVAEPEGGTELKWVRQIAQAAGWLGQITIVPEEQLPPTLRFDANGAAHLTTSSARIRTELGYNEIVDAEEALRCTVEWERANPPDQSPPDAFDYAAEDAILALMAT